MVQKYIPAVFEGGRAKALIHKYNKAKIKQITFA